MAELTPAVGNGQQMAQRLLRKEEVMNSRDFGFEDTAALDGASATADDRVLVAQAKCGCSSAFGELYERHRLQLFRSAFRIVRNREDAEDAVQRAFQRAFTALARFREDSSFPTWMTRIAINEALMLLRQRRRSSIPQNDNGDSEDAPAPEIVDERATPEQAFAEKEFRSLTRQAISRLRESSRSVILLRELQGLTSEETARRLGLTVSAVKARIFHARRHLRRHLKQNWLYSRCARPINANVALG
jgi:RNA polymerase sigma-70 factor, ECF subfamily